MFIQSQISGVDGGMYIPCVRILQFPGVGARSSEDEMLEVVSWGRSKFPTRVWEPVEVRGGTRDILTG